MSGETTITIIGNLTADPELRFSPSGAAVADFTIASTPRRFDKNANEWRDSETLFMRCSVWREAAENAAESLRKGMRVIAVGNLMQRSYETRAGEKRSVVEMQVDEVGPSLRKSKVVVSRTGDRASAPQAHGEAPRSAYQSNPAQPSAAAPATRSEAPSVSDPWGGSQDTFPSDPPF